MLRRFLRWSVISVLVICLGFVVSPTPGHLSDEAETPHRSPIALALSADGTRLITANQTADSVSLVDPVAGKVLAELTTGEKPAGVAISADGRRAAVTHWYGYDLCILEVGPDSLKSLGRVEVGPEPRGVAMTADGKTAYVAVGVTNEVARVDLDTQRVTGRVGVGREPRGLALSHDGATLLVGNSRSGNLSVVRTSDLSVERTQKIDGVSLRQVAIDPDGKYGYVANMRNRGLATTKNNIDLGWVLGQRLTRVLLDGSDDFTTLSLDPQGKAVSDAHGTAVSGDGKILAVSCGGTHEVLLFRTDVGRLPWRIGGSRDVMQVELVNSTDGRFRRVETGGRPTEVVFSPDGKDLYVANYLDDSVQVIDPESAQLKRSIKLGGPEELSLVRRGEVLFHEAKRSFNQWYSCNTCHSDGHTNGQSFDTMNDGWHDFSTTPKYSKKQVPTLRGVVRTGPWTWHGWQTELNDAMVESFTKSMQGPPPSSDDVEALVAYLGTLDHPKNPFRGSDGEMSEAAKRGEQVFQSEKAACIQCHKGQDFTDGEVHVVGLEERRDVYKGYNPPSLRGLYDTDPYLHDGRAATLLDALKGEHSADFVSGMGDLSEQEVLDLVEYLRAL
jgi:YVTN family beta-propeller protein